MQLSLCHGSVTIFTFYFLCKLSSEKEKHLHILSNFSLRQSAHNDVKFFSAAFSFCLFIKAAAAEEPLSKHLNVGPGHMMTVNQLQSGLNTGGVSACGSLFQESSLSFWTPLPLFSIRCPWQQAQCCWVSSCSQAGGYFYIYHITAKKHLRW